MGRNKKSEDAAPGAPEWMVTFCDCMTLLLTFFVLLVTFATFEKSTITELGESFARAMPSIGFSSASKKESMHEKQASRDPATQAEGTETRTLNEIMNSSNFMKEKKPLDFRNLKVFSVASEDFFWGGGTALSKTGTETLDALAVFLNSTTGRIVISENGPGQDPELGLKRALAVIQYLTKQKAMSEKRFSISGSTTMREKANGRRLEISLLERNIYE